MILYRRAGRRGGVIVSCHCRRRRVVSRSKIMPATLSPTQLQIRTTTLDSPVGPLMAGACDDGICMLEFAGLRSDIQEETPARRYGAEFVAGRHRFLDQLRGELGEYFAGRRREFDVPITVRGTTFQEAVWRALLRIPYG